MQRKEPSLVFYFVLLVLYLITYVVLSKASASDEVIELSSGSKVPLRSITGVLSSLANICLIFLVVFHKKLGFITSLILIGAQFPILFVKIAMTHNAALVQGLFTGLITLIAIVLIYQRNKKLEEYQVYELEYVIRQQKFSEKLFDQTATALVNAIDAKDTYSHGHSLRVAEYSVKIAKRLEKDEEECKRIYYAALLHDVGKIGIHENIICKPGKLTPEEYDEIKKHTVMGNLILSSINEYPYLSIGAHFHHERYDGKGYPLGLKGEDIPEIARIISVADAYDAMSSRRSYRDIIPQQLVREEIIKGAGTQFDPQFAKIMQDIIDEDGGYELKEDNGANEMAGTSDLECPEYRKEISDGIRITDCITRIHLKRKPAGKATFDKSGVAMILFDSLDGRFHEEETAVRDLHYFEYCELWLDGNIQSKEVRKIQTKTLANDEKSSAKRSDYDNLEYDIEAVKYKDHLLIKIMDGIRTIEVTIALPDSSRFVYIGLTGMYCHITDVSIKKDEKPINADYIPRIAEEISYINVPAGDIPNIQIDGHRSESTEGIPLGEKLQIDFHSMSLPTAGLIWHCPYFIIFYSDDGKVNGPNYHEYSLTRLDGEMIETGEKSETKIKTVLGSQFGNWDDWKAKNKAGFDGSVLFEKNKNVVTMKAENLGVLIENTTTILDGQEKLFVAVTGDECALTNIRIKND
ncbi:MAG: HD-GYP domain-containing protein [Lachnospiraceae bacterium]|nr:HD-GYP domain-containing protein [Lachnospiraceae bacterium]